MNRIWWTLVCAPLLLGAASNEGVYKDPNWIKRPSPEDLMGVWPRDAMRQGLGGKARIACVVTLQGALRDCVVVSESPAGAGFGAAAIAITPQLMMTPATRDGQPILSKVTIPINFETPPVPTGSHLAGGGVALARTMLSGVTWIEAPTYAEVAAAYPEKARKGQTAGKSILVCRFKSEGRVGSCNVIAEEPRSQGFGSAAKMLAPRFQGPSQLADGQPTQGMEVQIPFVFAAEMLDPQQRIIGKPKWTRLPKGEEVVSGYPPAAARAGVKGGRVTIRCEVAAEGRLAACATESEDPLGLGFAASALDLSKTFQVQLWTADGLPTVGGQIRVPIRYQLPNAPPAKP